MTELSDEARRLLHAGRTAFSPTPRELDAAHEALVAKLAAAQASASAPDMPEPGLLGSPTDSAATSGGMLKLVLVTVTAASLVVGYIAWQHRREPDAAPVPRASEPSRPLPGTSAPREPAPADLREPPPAPSSETTSTVHPARPRDAARARAKSHASQPTKPPIPAPTTERAASAKAEPLPSKTPAPELAPPDSSQLAREIESIRRARASLQQGRAEQTLEMLDAYVAQFPSGALREEQLALRAIALCGIGRMDAAEAVIRRLEAVAPGSPHLRRLERACRKNP